ncbi:hypothetical protein BBK82_43055 [Lentzea guizhouensis]|uniref:Uncharacterized protein n=1 Tax=Lentzea guizhouensis TaxID=1586287 RepID=A0A1B2HVF2_9PSEU|nr:hypothetical protein [Lentzea guizhouensis]ANZ41726.1 hypothetical protein BBK82_43055 [Lentzea guizhouensis]
MTGPDPRHSDQTHNQVRSDSLGNAFQTGQLHGDAHVGNTTVRNTTVSLSALGVVAGVVITVVAGLVVWKVVATETAPAVTSTTVAGGSTIRTSPKTSTPNDSTRPREIRLSSRTGVDLDGDETVAERVDGASGDTDLYMTETGILYTNGNGFADDLGTEQQARSRCTDAVAAGQNSAAQVLPIMAGMQYCFATSDDKIAWLRVKDSKLAASSSVVLAVQVWPKER